MKANTMNRSGFGERKASVGSLNGRVTFSSPLRWRKYGAALRRRRALAWKKGHEVESQSELAKGETPVRSESALHWEYFPRDAVSGEV